MGHGIPSRPLGGSDFELSHRCRAKLGTRMLGRGCSLQREFDKCQGLEAGTSLKKPLSFEEGSGFRRNSLKQAQRTISEVHRRINGDTKCGEFRAGSRETPVVLKTST